MLTAEGCAARRRRLMERLDPTPDWAIIADPRHLMYLANLSPEPFSWAAPAAPALLLIERDGPATLVVDQLAARRVHAPCADRVELVRWYNHVDSAGDRRRAVIERLIQCLPATLPGSIAVETRAVPVEVVRQLTDELSDRAIQSLDDVLLEMRAVKDADELDVICRAIRAGEAGHARSWEVVRPGVTELDVYREIASACTAVAGHAVVVYGDFAAGPSAWQAKGGAATERKLERGDTMILDFSVVIGGYRGDFTNTIAVGGEPTAEQRRLFSLLLAAIESGEQTIRPGASGAEIWAAVNAPLESADPKLRLPHHAGHGIGLSHPEMPVLTPKSPDRLAPGNVITLEPGVYVEGVGGMRIEHNYLVTDTGFERLTHHRTALLPGD